MKPHGSDALRIESLDEAISLDKIMDFVRDGTKPGTPTDSVLLVLGAVVKKHISEHETENGDPDKKHSLDFGGELAQIVLNAISIAAQQRDDSTLHREAKEMIDSYVQASIESLPDSPSDLGPPPGAS